MTNRRDFLKGLLSSIGGIMIVKPPSIDDVIKEPEKPKPPEPPRQAFFGGSSCTIKLTFDPFKPKEYELRDGYADMLSRVPDDVAMADTRKIDGYVEVSEEEFGETKRIIDAENAKNG